MYTMHRLTLTSKSIVCLEIKIYNNHRAQCVTYVTLSNFKKELKQYLINLPYYSLEEFFIIYQFSIHTSVIVSVLSSFLTRYLLAIVTYYVFV